MENFYGNIKVDNGTRRIGVNDDGDYIELSLADVTLFDRFASAVEWFEKKQAELTAYDADFKARHSGDEDNAAAVMETVHKRAEVFSECCQKLDDVSKGAVLNTRPQKGKQRKKEKGVPNLGRTNPRSKLGTPLVM